MPPAGKIWTMVAFTKIIVKPKPLIQFQCTKILFNFWLAGWLAFHFSFFFLFLLPDEFCMFIFKYNWKEIYFVTFIISQVSINYFLFSLPAPYSQDDEEDPPYSKKSTYTAPLNLLNDTINDKVREAFVFLLLNNYIRPSFSFSGRFYFLLYYIQGDAKAGMH